MALPCNGTILATSADRKGLYERASKRIVEMAKAFGKLGPGPGLPLPESVVAETLSRSATTCGSSTRESRYCATPASPSINATAAE